MSVNSRAAAEAALAWVLSPMPVDVFFDEYWEQKPLLIQRSDRRAHYATAWAVEGEATDEAQSPPLSSAMMRQWMRDGVLTHEHDVTVTRYDLKQRKRLNLDDEKHGAVDLNAMEARLAEGCSVRLLCPHAHSRPLWQLLSALQSAFGTFVGSNAYFTPCNSQGFAPHYDDIEAFILQLEGRKRWFVYPPPSPAQTLPRFSSNDFNRAYRGSAEAAAAADPHAPPGVTPAIDTVLEPGDLLYFPRGWVHHAEAVDADTAATSSSSRSASLFSKAASSSSSAAGAASFAAASIAPELPPDAPSLHLTISTALRNTWRDLIEIMVRAALETAADGDDAALRASLPPNFAEHLGIAASDRDDASRNVMLGAVAGASLQYFSARRANFVAHARDR
jgi:lysine-specific demethylase/histidyl-hydroxylase NO66